MQASLCTTLLVTFAVAVNSACSAPRALSQGSWVITFEDDFLGTTLNESSWTASNYSSIVSQYDGHDALFIADRVTVGNGKLSISTVFEPTTFNNVNYNFTSGWIDGQQKRNQTLGRFEASMKMPNNGAVGAWPAWWLLPEKTCWPISGGELGGI